MPEGDERTGVLVIRAWMTPEQRELVARLTGRTDVTTSNETSVTASGVEAAARIAGDWLAAFERDAQMP